jgi:hypothetical protein
MGRPQSLPEVVGRKRLPGACQLGEFLHEDTPWRRVGTAKVEKGILDPPHLVVFVAIAPWANLPGRPGT